MDYQGELDILFALINGVIFLAIACIAYFSVIAVFVIIIDKISRERLYKNMQRYQRTKLSEAYMKPETDKQEEETSEKVNLEKNDNSNDST